MDPVTAMIVGATTLKMAGQYQAGNLAESSGKAEARQYERSADETYASGTREAAEIRRQGNALESDAVAAMAAGGGVSDDAGAIDTRSDIQQLASYNALSALYGAETEAERLKYAGRMARWSGHQARKSSYLAMGATALSGGAAAMSVGTGGTVRPTLKPTTATPRRSGSSVSPGRKTI